MTRPFDMDEVLRASRKLQTGQADIEVRRDLTSVNGLYVEELHGPKRQRAPLSRGRIPGQRNSAGALQC